MRLKLAIVLILVSLAEFNGCYAVAKELKAKDINVPTHVDYIN